MTTQNVKIDVHHLTRVEGHGNIVVNVSNGKIEKCQWQVPEAPRFFEAMVRGRHYSEVQRITSRICGICSVGHTMAAVDAIENACGIHETEQTLKMRNVLKMAEIFDSHMLHVMFLVAPDLLGVKSVFPLVPTHGEVVKLALRMKRFSHEWGSLFAGRTTHPTKAVPGGFSSTPTTEELIALRKRFDAEVLPDLKVFLEVICSVAGNIPIFERKTEYIAINNDKEYGIYHGMIQSIMPDGTIERYPVKDFAKVVNEYVVPQSTAKYAKNKAPSYMAGALARFNNNYNQLCPEAKAVSEKLGFKPMNFNTYYNSVAQVVEIVHCTYETMRILDDLIRTGVKDEELQKPTKFGEGWGMVEVPRGILFHSYTFDKDGMCTSGDCVIPTNQNHANIQLDFEKVVPELLNANKTEKEIELALEMMVRSYDPCISCSTHYLDVKFVK